MYAVAQTARHVPKTASDQRKRVRASARKRKFTAGRTGRGSADQEASLFNAKGGGGVLRAFLNGLYAEERNFEVR